MTEIIITKLFEEIRKRFPEEKNLTIYIDFSCNKVYIETETGTKLTTKSNLVNTLISHKLKKVVAETIKVDTGTITIKIAEIKVKIDSELLNTTIVYVYKCKEYTIETTI